MVRDYRGIIRGALFGCGQVSRFHLEAWRHIDGVEIVTLYNRTKNKALVRATEFGIPAEKVYDDCNELLEKEEIDFVDIATAPQVHCQHVLAVASFKKHILCQKPLASSLKDVEKMISACDHARVMLMVNENWRWQARYRELKQLINQGLVGQPRYVRVEMRSDICLPGIDGSPPPLATKQPYTLDLQRLIVFEWGTHIIDVLRFLFGEVISVYARMDRVNTHFRGEDIALIVLDFGHVIAQIDINWASPVIGGSQSERVTIEGKKGWISFMNDSMNKLLLKTRSEEKRITVRPGQCQDPYQASYIAAQSHFIECLCAGKIPETHAHDNYHTLSTTFAAYESALYGNTVFMNEFNRTYTTQFKPGKEETT
ncbi:MAG: Gfo/Idh/MocA family oxidoreductase [Anaerolineales bacterium]|nr:Gfo/Idh/MocA family oxidoreductase [Anaerolineales bacterium]